MPRIIMYFVCAQFITASALAQNWQAQFEILIHSEPGPDREQLISSIVASGCSWQDIKGKIESVQFPDTTKGLAIRRYNPCIDSESRPYVLYIPSSYNPKKPLPMLVILHDSVSREYIMPDPKGWAEKTEYVTLAEEHGWFVLFPMGQTGATWWDNIGMTNIMALVRRMKSNFNIDDNRIYLGGFSDGGSAGFLFAMTIPSDFAAFFALNGHMGIGSEIGNLPTYAPNLYNSPIYAASTRSDQVYPASQMERAIDMAIKAGAKIQYRLLEGGHEFNNVEGELPKIFDYFEQHLRNPYTKNIIWETAVKNFGICKWLAIDEVTVSEPPSWYIDYNIALVDSLIVLGIVPSDTFTGYGVMVEGVIEGSFAEKRLSLQNGDIITRVNNLNISNIEDLDKFESSLKHGDRISMLFTRSINGLGAISRIPPPRNYLLFKRELPSAMIKAEYNKNHFKLKGSRVGAFRILINPDMVDLKRNVVVIFNGKKLFDERVEPDIDYMLRNYLVNRDRKLVFVNEISLRTTK